MTAARPYCPIPTPAGYDPEKVWLHAVPGSDEMALSVKWQVPGGKPVYCSNIIEPARVGDTKMWEDMLIQVRIYVRSRGQPDHKPNSINRNGTELLSDHPPSTGEQDDKEPEGGSILSFHKRSDGTYDLTGDGDGI
jgi:hypothetical protein